MNIPQYVADLHANSQAALELIRHYTPAQLAAKNAGECSVAELLEHICISDRRTLDFLTSQSGSVAEVSELHGDEKLRRVVVEYKGGPKITAIELQELTGAVTDVPGFRELFLRQRLQLQQALEGGHIALTNHTYPHLYLGAMTVTDWLRYLLHHTNRHLGDIRDVVLTVKTWDPAREAELTAARQQAEKNRDNSTAPNGQ
ncbi:DinB family protein [Hymenobacter sp. H14-R3]|uniref:DinB family protein n=1 Tax=Hymenobacter sp. H14-R3 TaxID=3046308 RepID=UPI0024B94748|nr:DinB family protein [Hymenobacter sp. H14-R3]MDJ0367476.1 DinB family protein [Hymenobacter sp. H14-R3]